MHPPHWSSVTATVLVCRHDGASETPLLRHCGSILCRRLRCRVPINSAPGVVKCRNRCHSRHEPGSVPDATRSEKGPRKEGLESGLCDLEAASATGLCATLVTAPFSTAANRPHRTRRLPQRLPSLMLLRRGEALRIARNNLACAVPDDSTEPDENNRACR